MSTYLITGSTGFIGSLLIKHIYDVNPNAEFVLPVRNIEKAKNIHAPLLDRITFINSSVENLDVNHIFMSIDFIIHCAAITKSKEMLEHPIEVTDGIIYGTQNILEIAREKKVKSMVYLSSMEVYGKVEDTGKLLSEEELGDIKINSPRSCYSLSKRMAEHYCFLYNYKFGVPVKIARLSQIFGKGVPYNDTRVFAEFARAVIEKNDIILHTSGMSVGNYCEVYDAINAIEIILENGLNGESYNVVNEANTMTIKAMAELVVKKFGDGELKVICEEKEPLMYGYAENTGLRLSSKKICDLGWKPIKNLEQMYDELINSLKNKRIDII